MVRLLLIIIIAFFLLIPVYTTLVKLYFYLKNKIEEGEVEQEIKEIKAKKKKVSSKLDKEEKELKAKQQQNKKLRKEFKHE